MLFSQSHSKFSGAGPEELYIIPLPKFIGSLRCGCTRYASAQVSALPSAGLGVAAAGAADWDCTICPAAPVHTLVSQFQLPGKVTWGSWEDKTEADPIWDWGQKKLCFMLLQYDPPKLLIQSSSTNFLSIPMLQEGVPSMLPHICGLCCGINL